MGAKDTVFLDTNIFVYPFLPSEPHKHTKAIALIESSLKSGRGVISYQLVQDFANVARKNFATRLGAEDCKAFIGAAMQPLYRVASSTLLIHTVLDLQVELKYSFYDCLMLGAASPGLGHGVGL